MISRFLPRVSGDCFGGYRHRRVPRKPLTIVSTQRFYLGTWGQKSVASASNSTHCCWARMQQRWCQLN